MQNRRQTLKQGAVAAGALACGSLLPLQAQAFTKAAFEAKSVADAAKAFGGNTLVESKEVSIQGPDIAENGAVVPLTAATTLTGVKSVLLLVEKNPNALVAKFDVNENIVPSFGTRAKMGQSSDVYAVAITADGKAHFAKKEVKVTLGGCGG